MHLSALTPEQWSLIFAFLITGGMQLLKKLYPKLTGWEAHMASAILGGVTALITALITSQVETGAILTTIGLPQFAYQTISLTLEKLKLTQEPTSPVTSTGPPGAA